ncbi:uncharacterized protein LOC142231536 [Haematobia irritans]|uniref:uncharacterized protein LOC142231536 n=1 Tax=Haematobia irritans TaxID=7368 RepID=UPI003F4F4162
MENPYQSLLLNIAGYFVKDISHQESPDSCRSITTLIRLHNEKLGKFGDISFPSNSDIWSKYFPASKGFKLNENSFELINEVSETSGQELLDKAKTWNFPVFKFKIEQERCHLYLQRSSITRNLIQQVLGDPQCYGNLRKSSNCCVRIMALQQYGLDQEDISFYRAKLLHQTLKRIASISRWQVEDDNVAMSNSCNLEINVQSVASKISPEVLQESSVTMKCGLVTDPITKGRVCQLTTQDYLSLRSNDVSLMALHKYGIRVKQDSRFSDLMKRLGSAAVTVDLLEVKHTSPVQIIRNGQGSTKGASFILYNSARLETLLRTFDERIERRDYGTAPEISDIDWSLLNEEEEWQMVFAYLAGFPDLIERCVEQLDRGICATHLIIRFLNGLVSIFSVYYRRIRILTEKRDQLMPYVYARIYLIRAVREVLNKTLSLLDIEPVEFM